MQTTSVVGGATKIIAKKRIILVVVQFQYLPLGK